MPIKPNRDDSALVVVEGGPLPYEDLMAIANVSAADVSAALDYFHETVPERYKELLD